MTDDHFIHDFQAGARLARIVEELQTEADKAERVYLFEFDSLDRIANFDNQQRAVGVKAIRNPRCG